MFYDLKRYGKEDKLVNLFGIMQALVSFVQDDKDNLCSIVSGDHQFVFVCRGPLVLVAVSQTCQSVNQASQFRVYDSTKVPPLRGILMGIYREVYSAR